MSLRNTNQYSKITTRPGHHCKPNRWLPQFWNYTISHHYRSWGECHLKIVHDYGKSSRFHCLYKIGKHPTQTAYDIAIDLSEEKLVSDCKSSEKCTHNILISCNASGKYYIGLLQGQKNRTVHSRVKRSVLSAAESQEKCVKFKDPPPTLAPPVKSIILEPQYDPESSVNYSLQVNAIWCMYWSETEERWTNEGCKVTS